MLFKKVETNPEILSVTIPLPLIIGRPGRGDKPLWIFGRDMFKNIKSRWYFKGYHCAKNHKMSCLFLILSSAALVTYVLGHGAMGSKTWGSPAYIDDMYLRNPMEPPDKLGIPLERDSPPLLMNRNKSK